MAKINSVKGKAGKNSRNRKTETRVAKKNNAQKRLTNNNLQVRRFEVAGILCAAFALIAMCGLLNFNVGFVGLSAAKMLHYFFGIGAWPASLAVFAFGGYLVMKHELPPISISLISSVFFFAFVLGCFHHFVIAPGKEILPESLPNGGGLLGGCILFVVRKFLGVTGSIIILGAGAVAALLVATGWSLAKGIFASKEKAVRGVDFAKDKIEASYQKLKKQEIKLKNRAEESFYDQEKDEKYNRKAQGEQQPELQPAVQPVLSAQAADLVEEVRPAKPPLPRITNEHSIIEPPDWGEPVPVVTLTERENDVTEGTVELAEDFIADSVDEFTDEVIIEEEKAELAAEFVAAEEDTDADDVIDISDILAEIESDTDVVAEENQTTEVDVSVEEISAAAEQEKLVPAFTIQYSRSGDETVASVTEASNAQENICSADANAQLDYADRDFNQADEGKIAADELEEVEVASHAKRFDDEADLTEEKKALPEYIMPKVSELLNPPNKLGHEGLELEIAENAEILAKTLEDFKVKANIINACHGPAVTRYELTPAPGVKVSKITGLSQDLALALAAVAVRIEPVPGKACIGVEVPNKVLESVPLCEVLQSKEFTEAKSPLTVGLGMDISGHAITADLGKMPHLLVAGATGSGKSVCVNTLITSILFKARPDEVKFILIDPKMVELSNYNGIPHLMVPVVTDMRKAASVLNWAVQEMEKRYAKFAAAGARDMARYNNLVAIEDKIPAVVIIIDELADLMMVAPHDVEDAIFRLAQKARAAGIHLVLATQRPSVDVITGTIKSNIPSRISFAVSSQVDSRTILDDNGAEMLLGKGDMLFLPMGASKAQRVQGAFISDEEVEALLDFIRNQGQEIKPDEDVLSFTENVGSDNKNGDENHYDELLLKAVELVISTGAASTTNLQRRFHIGYGRAAGLIDVMEELSIVGPRNGSKPREILVTAEEARELIGL